jgi:outer membrane protein assembly factor BamB
MPLGHFNEENTMKSGRGLLGLVGCVAAAVVVGQALAGDWPQWRGPARDGKSPDFKAPAGWPKDLNKKWSLKVGAGDSGPVVVGDKLFVFARQGDDEVTLCLDAATNKELWRDKFASPKISGPDARIHAGPRSTPAVADGKIVTIGVIGTISCLDAEKGSIAWRKENYKVVPQFHTACSPLIADKLVVAQVGSEKEGAVVALDLADGSEKWKWSGDGQGYSSPVLATIEGVKQVVALTQNKVVGLALADGKLLWQADFPAKGRMSYNAATPILDGSTVIVTGDGRGTKAFKIEKKGDGLAATEAWANADVGCKFSTPVLVEGLLFGVSDKGKLFCLRAKDGTSAWQEGEKLDGYGAMVAGGGVGMALPSNGELIVFKPAEKFEQLGKYKVGATATYAPPAVLDNRIFVKDQEELVLWTVE